MQFTMLTVATFKNSASKGDWGMWHNTYHFDGFDEMGRQQARELSRKVLEFEGGLHRVDTNFVACGIQIGDAAGMGSDAPKYATALPFGAGNAFRRPATDEALWRYALGVRKHIMYGRHPHMRYMNCICEADTYRDERDAIALKERNSFDQWIADKQMNDWDAVWKYEKTYTKAGIPFAAPIPTQVLGRYGAFAIDQHANTRWRRRAASNGLTNFGKVAGLLVRSAMVINANIEMIGYNIDFVPEGYFIDTVTVLGAGKKMLDDLEDYFRDADQDGTNEDKPPVTRFGVTSANVTKGFLAWANFAENDLPELLKVYKPKPNVDGRSYISSADLNIYDEALRDFLDNASVGWFFDWRNPRAYEKNEENWLPEGTPDLVELAW